ncbi:hypothetical protein Vretimale_14641 [Volvox reticuliferus]|uniref:Uncharacterized protein n=1 Tax=Volvox reticuliferus TaxID=1737510 RepID=A0A8J4CQ24_9CHLO|nr:hypothetical protein Vretifemale_15685 [Volvox reticuliferus]GIM11117.1 hypothetical protein Vretimale_14641 [Volvox reticuliferus]
MSRLARYLREHGAVGTNFWLKLLINGSKICNIVLLLVGFSIISYSGALYVAQSGGDGTHTTPAWPSGPPPVSTIIFASMGCTAVLSAAAALAATSRHSLALLNIHLGLLALLMAAQVCLAAAVATYDNANDETGTVVPDIQGRFRYVGGGGHGDASNAVRGELRAALLAYKVADAVTLGVETVTLLVGCLLHSAYMRADAQAEDMEEGLLPDSASPLLTSRRREAQEQQHQHGRRTPLPPRVVRDDSWSRRMREQYGVDTSMLSYNPEQGGGRMGPSPRGAGLPADAASRGRCIIS